MDQSSNFSNAKFRFAKEQILKAAPTSEDATERANDLIKDWETALESGSVIPLGKSLDLTWQSAFVVPTYLIEGNPGGNAPTPGLRTAQDIRNYANVFAKPGSNGKAVLWNCVALSKCGPINQKQVTAYGLDDVIQLRDPGSYDALIEKLLLANEGKTPWLGCM